MSSPKPIQPRRQAGFSLVELLVVIGIIAVMAGVAMPQIGQYIRNYRIRGASQAVASELTSARTKAIMKNVNHGVIFMVVSNNTYRYVIEDRQDVPAARDAITFILGTPAMAEQQAGPLRILPERVEFGAGCAGFAPDLRGVRFNRLGGQCGLGLANCPDIDTGLVSMMAVAANATVCLREVDTNLTRLLTINAAGRVIEPQ